MGTRPPAIIIKTTVTERQKLNDRLYDYITMLLSIHLDDSLQLNTSLPYKYNKVSKTETTDQTDLAIRSLFGL